MIFKFKDYTIKYIGNNNVEIRDKNGKLKYQGHIKKGGDGKIYKHGYGKTFNNNGKLIFEGSYNNGRRELGKEFDNNGNALFIGKYQNGKYLEGLLYRGDYTSYIYQEGKQKVKIFTPDNSHLSVSEYDERNNCWNKKQYIIRNNTRIVSFEGYCEGKDPDKNYIGKKYDKNGVIQGEFDSDGDIIKGYKYYNNGLIGIVKKEIPLITINKYDNNDRLVSTTATFFSKKKIIENFFYNDENKLKSIRQVLYGNNDKEENVTIDNKPTDEKVKEITSRVYENIVDLFYAKRNKQNITYNIITENNSSNKIEELYRKYNITNTFGLIQKMKQGNNIENKNVIKVEKNNNKINVDNIENKNININININNNDNDKRKFKLISNDNVLEFYYNYLINKGIDEFIEVTKAQYNNKLGHTTGDYINSQMKTDKFFEYFGISNEFINKKQNNMNVDKYSLNKELQTKIDFLNFLKSKIIKNNGYFTDENKKYLSIIAMGAQNLKFRVLTLVDFRDAFLEQELRNGIKEEKMKKEIKKNNHNFIQFITQSQYFTRIAENCETTFKYLNRNANLPITQDILKMHVADTNNFLQKKLSMMPIYNPDEKQDKELCKQHYNLIANNFKIEIQELLKKNQNKKIKLLLKTASLWKINSKELLTKNYDGKDMNLIVLEQYINMLKSLNDNDRKKVKIIFFGKSKEFQDMINKNKISDCISLYDYTEDDKKDKPKEIKESEDEEVIYVNSGDHIAFVPNEGYVYFGDQCSRGSSDVHMVKTNYFRYLTGKGGLNKNGVYDDESVVEKNGVPRNKLIYQGLKMPAKFIGCYEGKNLEINASEAIKDFNKTIEEKKKQKQEERAKIFKKCKECFEEQKLEKNSVNSVQIEHEQQEEYEENENNNIININQNKEEEDKCTESNEQKEDSETPFVGLSQNQIDAVNQVNDINNTPKEEVINESQKEYIEDTVVNPASSCINKNNMQNNNYNMQNNNINNNNNQNNNIDNLNSDTIKMCEHHLIKNKNHKKGQHNNNNMNNNNYNNMDNDNYNQNNIQNNNNYNNNNINYSNNYNQNDNYYNNYNQNNMQNNNNYNNNNNFNYNNNMNNNNYNNYNNNDINSNNNYNQNDNYYNNYNQNNMQNNYNNYNNNDINNNYTALNKISNSYHDYDYEDDNDDDNGIIKNPIFNIKHVAQRENNDYNMLNQNNIMYNNNNNNNNYNNNMNNYNNNNNNNYNNSNNFNNNNNMNNNNYNYNNNCFQSNIKALNKRSKSYGNRINNYNNYNQNNMQNNNINNNYNNNFNNFNNFNNMNNNNYNNNYNQNNMRNNCNNFNNNNMNNNYNYNMQNNNNCNNMQNNINLNLNNNQYNNLNH